MKHDTHTPHKTDSQKDKRCVIVTVHFLNEMLGVNDSVKSKTDYKADDMARLEELFGHIQTNGSDVVLAHRHQVLDDKPTVQESGSTDAVVDTSGGLPLHDMGFNKIYSDVSMASFFDYHLIATQGGYKPKDMYVLDKFSASATAIGKYIDLANEQEGHSNDAQMDYAQNGLNASGMDLEAVRRYLKGHQII